MWNPWKTHWALALAKGIREPDEAKKKSFDLGGNRTHDLRIRSTVTLPTELPGRTEKVGDESLYLVWFPRSSVGAAEYSTNKIIWFYKLSW